MNRLRKAEERGFVDLGWLKSYHTFSFADYHDPRWMHFRGLRVINQDYFLPNTGFNPHPHQDMEIVSYVISGQLTHQDSFGNKATLGPGEIQRMSAGTGIVHSERNHGPGAISMLQIWMLPLTRGIPPSYEQRSYLSRAAEPWLLLAAPANKGGLVSIHADARIYRFATTTPRRQVFEFQEGRHVWVQMVKGKVKTAGETLEAGDGLGLEFKAGLAIDAEADTELLVFDLA